MDARYDELAAKVDAFHDRVETRHPGALTCHAGCSRCCHQHLTVVPLEWARLADAVEARNAFVDPALVKAYYEAHGLTAKNIEVTDQELDAYYEAVMKTVMGGSADDNDALRRHLNAAKQEILPDELTDDEFRSWQILITRSFLNDGGKGAFHDQVAAAKLEWTRRAHLKELRGNADIEILVDLD